jgi:prevent-host-death family protein
MTERVSTMDVRARIGDMLNRVALRHDEFIIERKGQPLAALVPVERLEQMRRFARQHALEFLALQKEGLGDQALSDEEAMSVALEAQRAVRRQIRRAEPRPKRSRKKT